MRLKESSNVDTNSKDPGSSFEESTSVSKVIREKASLNSGESLLLIIKFVRRIPFSFNSKIHTDQFSPSLMPVRLISLHRVVLIAKGRLSVLAELCNFPKDF